VILILFPNQLQYIENATNNGVLTFVLGALFVMSIYHFVLYFQHKEKSYLLYSCYAFLIFLTYMSKVESGFLKDFSLLFGKGEEFQDFYRWLYNGMYFYFAVSFLELKKVNKKWYQFIIYPISIILFFGFLAQFLASFFNQYGFYNFYQRYYLYLMIVITLFSFWVIFQLKGVLKYYIIVGALLLFITSLIGEYRIRTLSFINISKSTGDFIFYVGVFIENICFSLGLGHKQKLILKERNEANKKLRSKLQENEQLKEKVQQQLQEKVDALKTQIYLQKEIDSLKLTALQSQMNPHFIFNALNSIKLYIINNDQKNAVSYLNKFSKLIRKILEASTVKQTSLEEELATTNLYMSIENIRFDKAIDFSIYVDPKIHLSTIKVPPLLLQPFLENALWHGLSSKKGDKKIAITIHKKDESHLLISIEDNGIGRKAAAKIKAQKTIKRKSIGMKLTQDRLKNFAKEYTFNYQLTCEDVKNNAGNSIGTRIKITIPLF